MTPSAACQDLSPRRRSDSALHFTGATYALLSRASPALSSRRVRRRRPAIHISTAAGAPETSPSPYDHIPQSIEIGYSEPLTHRHGGSRNLKRQILPSAVLQPLAGVEGESCLHPPHEGRPGRQSQQRHRPRGARAGFPPQRQPSPAPAIGRVGVGVTAIRHFRCESRMQCVQGVSSSNNTAPGGRVQLSLRSVGRRRRLHCSGFRSAYVRILDAEKMQTLQHHARRPAPPPQRQPAPAPAFARRNWASPKPGVHRCAPSAASAAGSDGGAIKPCLS